MNSKNLKLLVLLGFVSVFLIQCSSKYERVLVKESGTLKDLLEEVTYEQLEIKTAKNTVLNKSDLEYLKSYVKDKNVKSLNLKNAVIGEGARMDFKDCSSLQKVYLPASFNGFKSYFDGNDYSQDIFFGCNNLGEILVDKNNEYFRDIGGVLFNKNGNRLIKFPDAKRKTIYKVPKNVTTIVERAFSYSNSLGKIIIPNSVTTIGVYSFGNLVSLRSIDVGKDNIAYKSIDGVLFNKSGDTLIRFPPGKNVSIYTIPNSVNIINQGAFNGSKYLSKISMSGLVSTIGHFAFDDCKNLIDIYMPSGIKEIGQQAFRGCNSLISVNIPDSVISIGASAFIDCINMKEIDVHNDNNYYKSIQGVLFNNQGDKLIQYPAGKEETYYEIPFGTQTIDASAFRANKYLDDIVIPSSVITIETGAFFNCSNLKMIHIPEKVSRIDRTVLSGCSSLTDIKVNKNNETFYDVDGVLFLNWQSSLLKYPRGKQNKFYLIPEGTREIFDDAFGFCEFIEKLIIPKSVQKIGYIAFRNCYLLSEVIIQSIVPPDFDSSGFIKTHTDLQIKVPKESVLAYKSAYGWKDYADRIVGY